MAKRKRHVEDRPVHGVSITTYDEYREDIDAFADGKFQFLMVIGAGGIGKTEARRRLKNAVVVDTKVSPFSLYKLLYENIDATFVLDDLPQKFYMSDDAIAMLKALTETRNPKTISYRTASFSGDSDVPPSFKTSSRLLLIANKWNSLDENVRALESRGTTIVFEPTPWEVHQEVARGGWFHDAEVFDFIYDNLHLIRQPSFRHYTEAKKQKDAGRPWQKRLLEWLVGDVKQRQLIELLADPGFANHTERALAFERLGYGTERTFWRLKKELQHFNVPKSQIGENPKLTGCERKPTAVKARAC